jgi:hypothetical protein
MVEYRKGNGRCKQSSLASSNGALKRKRTLTSGNMDLLVYDSWWKALFCLEVFRCQLLLVLGQPTIVFARGGGQPVSQLWGYFLVCLLFA